MLNKQDMLLFSPFDQSSVCYEVAINEKNSYCSCLCFFEHSYVELWKRIVEIYWTNRIRFRVVWFYSLILTFYDDQK